jgi:hypothetical protein
MPFNVKNLLKDTQVQLEKVASDKFGDAVEDFVKGGMGGLGKKVDPAAIPNRNEPGHWYATSYAAALAGTTDYRPKMKFLFKVEFIFTQEAKRQYEKIFDGAKANDFTFMIKMIDRPKVDFEYDEDVNMYNFRTKALKRIIHRDLTMQIMDDVGNRVFDFFRYLMALHSPIVRGQFQRDNTLKAPSGDKITTGSGMSWLKGGAGIDNAHRGVLDSGFGNSIECIRVKQIFVNPVVGLSDATQMVSFDFINPRIVSFDLDELSHEANDVNLLTMVFGYDWMEMVKVGPLGGVLDDYKKSSYNVRSAGALGAPPDIMPGPGGKSNNPGGGGLVGAFGGVLNRQIDKATRQLTSDLISKGVKSLAGNSRLGQALGGQLTSQLSGPLSGLVTGAARDTLGGAFSSIKNPFARASGSAVTDGSVAGGGTAASVVPNPRGDY